MMRVPRFDPLLFGSAAAAVAALIAGPLPAQQGVITGRVTSEQGNPLGGASVSVGERQLLSFARAVAADPALLLLDEATSAVDSEIEAEIQRALARLMRGRTTIAIAHRLSTIVAADEILVLHHGEIRERGRHRDLLGAHGLYARLYRLQTGEFADGERLS